MDERKREPETRQPEENADDLPNAGEGADPTGDLEQYREGRRPAEPDKMPRH